MRLMGVEGTSAIVVGWFGTASWKDGESLRQLEGTMDLNSVREACSHVLPLWEFVVD